MVEKNEVTKEIQNEIKQDVKETKKFIKNYWLVSTVILALLLVAVLANNYGYIDFQKNKVGNNAITFFNTQLSQTPGTLEGITQVSGVYQVMIGIDNQQVPLYFTKDGNFINPGYALIPITGSAINSNSNTNTQTQTQAPVEIPKSSAPTLELFVWSFCPGGVYGESVISPLATLFGNKINTKVRFIGPVTTDKQAAGTSCFSSQGKSIDEGINECCITYNYNSKTYYSCALHNSKTNLLESQESERQACIQKISGTEKLFQYLTSFNAECISKKGDAAQFETCWKSALDKNKIPGTDITSCVNQKQGLKLLIEDYEYGQSLGGISSSPSYFVNKAQLSPTSSDNLKDSVCSAFNNAPTECSQVVQQSTTTNSGVQCG
ncbi:MAG: hypothetical protein Q7S33_00570 [Nanoarchaeota archaeon]|nr:hypothetical protein [Nanoarchaeota archaeon]